MHHANHIMTQVASCLRTQDNGRYLPEWVAYHWALGVDEFVVLDDDSLDDTREVRNESCELIGCSLEGHIRLHVLL